MSDIIIGSARIDERGKASGGKAGDQKQTSSNDYRGEVSKQPFYVPLKGLYVLRAKVDSVALKLASSMITACDNPNLGYDQNQRLGVITYGTGSSTKTECDCSSLVRRCVIEASGIDPGNFNTANEKSVLMNTGLFNAYDYSTGFTLYTGDILVTRTKGHTSIVVAGNARGDNSPRYPKYRGSTVSIVSALSAIGEKDTSYAHRAKIAAANGIADYKGSAYQNTVMLNLLKQGNLKKC